MCVMTTLKSNPILVPAYLKITLAPNLAQLQEYCEEFSELDKQAQRISKDCSWSEDARICIKAINLDLWRVSNEIARITEAIEIICSLYGIDAMQVIAG